MSKPRDFILFTADGEQHAVTGPTLRTVLRNSSAIDAKSPIVAAIPAGSLPFKPAEDLPFVAVMLKNPMFVQPEWPQ